MAAITISRQIGSLGRDTAQEVARQLGFRLVWREVINQAAARAGAPEAALAAIDELGLFGKCTSQEACQAYRTAVQRVMEEMAAGGDIVIVGRAGQVILHDWPQVLHVRVAAPETVRIQRVAEAQHITLAQAQAQVRASDSFRRKYLKRFYAAEWENPAWYDLIVNTARLEPAGAAAAVCRAFSEFLNSHLWQEKFSVDLTRKTSP